MPTAPAIQKVVASDGAAQDWFGSSVLVSGDLAIIGSPDAAVAGHAGQGAVYVFRRKDGVWAEAQKLVSSDGGPFDRFGQAIALLGETTLVVTAPLAQVNGLTWVGAAYVFTLSGRRFVQTQKLTPANPVAFGTFGKSVALNNGYALIGAGGATSNNVRIRGSVYVFRLIASGTGGTWSEAQHIAEPDPGDDSSLFGYPIAISGSTALVGAYASTVGGNVGQGAAYVFKFVGGAWTETAKLVANDGAARANFGISLALQGKTAFIGAPGATVHGHVSQGAVYRFEETGPGWHQVQQLVDQQGAALSLFGASVSFVRPNVLIGAYAVNNYTGAAYIFGQPNPAGAFSFKRKLLAPDGGSGDVFGYYNALDADIALVPAWGADVGTHAAQGAAYFFKLGPLGP
ncbi:MAG TPA: hypothetical protein VKB52_04040 [Rhodanobacteraceae bacterium]|nr:hypothetical protein [Rhodanobacteraceae bacterium]